MLLSPSIQKPGHRPWAAGIQMLASTMPYCCENRPEVSSWADT